MPNYAYYDWVKYSSYTPGRGDNGTDFTSEWIDPFDYFDESRWEKATHTFGESLCRFSESNVFFQDGFMILAIDHIRTNSAPSPITKNDIKLIPHEIKLNYPQTKYDVYIQKNNHNDGFYTLSAIDLHPYHIEFIPSNTDSANIQKYSLLINWIFNYFNSDQLFVLKDETHDKELRIPVQINKNQTNSSQNATISDFTHRIQHSNPNSNRLWSFCIGDVNGDGFKDIAYSTLEFYTSKTYLILGKSSELLKKNNVVDEKIIIFDHQTLNPYHSILMADIDGDSLDDLIIDGYTKIKIFYGKKTNTLRNYLLQESDEVINNASLVHKNAYDFNKDGIQDLIFKQKGEDDSIYIIYGCSRDRYEFGKDVDAISHSKKINCSNLDISHIEVGDFNGDTHLDILTGNHDINIICGQSDDFISSVQFSLNDINDKAVVHCIKDLDQDQCDELLVKISNGKYYKYSKIIYGETLTSSSTISLDDPEITTINFEFQDFRSLKFNNDSTNDLVFLNRDELHQLKGFSKQRPQFITIHDVDTVQLPQFLNVTESSILDIYDFDSDNQNDLLLIHDHKNVFIHVQSNVNQYYKKNFSLTSHELHFQFDNELSKTIYINHNQKDSNPISGIVTTDSDWIQIDKTSFSNLRFHDCFELRISVDRTNMKQGEYTGTISVKTEGYEDSIKIHLTIQEDHITQYILYSETSKGNHDFNIGQTGIIQSFASGSFKELINENPFEGHKHCQFKTEPGKNFKWALTASSPNFIDLSKYAHGSIHFACRIDSNYHENFKIGIKDKTQTYWIDFPNDADGLYGLYRDNQWHKVIIPLKDFNILSSLEHVSHLFVMEGNSENSQAYIEFDDFYYLMTP